MIDFETRRVGEYMRLYISHNDGVFDFGLLDQKEMKNLKDCLLEGIQEIERYIKE